MICEKCGKEMSTHDSSLYHCYNCDLYYDKNAVLATKTNKEYSFRTVGELKKILNMFDEITEITITDGYNCVFCHEEYKISMFDEFLIGIGRN